MTHDKNGDKYAVFLRHAYKNYGTKKKPNFILNDLKMSVNQGEIYGLLGASGCGKTTLLSCIVGRKKLNSGDIMVLGGVPGNRETGVPGNLIGYMPQEIALYGDFTIKETLRYFGWIYGMSTSEIYERSRFLISFLDLPDQSRMVKNLSGGERRRVSFAVALIHDPEMLILDEPTVGVDPILRQHIWEHLIDITNTGNKTVILTTHYIEEASKADTIGLMRHGTLLAEAPPNFLLRAYKCSSLEEVFLKLSTMQSHSIYKGTTSGSLYFNELLPRRFTMKISKFNRGTLGKLKALLQKDSLNTIRNISMMLFIFVLPIIQVVLFCLTIGSDPAELKLGIVNHEVPYLNVKSQPCNFLEGCNPINLSCRYLHHLQGGRMKLSYFKDIETARKAVIDGETWGTIYIKSDFSKATMERAMMKYKVDKNTLIESEIDVWLDMSNQQIGIVLQRDIVNAYKAFTKRILKDCGKNQNEADLPIRWEKPIYGPRIPVFLDFMASGTTITMIFFLAVALTSDSLIVERISGLYDRMWVAGVTDAEIITSHVVIQFVVMCGQTAIVLIFMFLVFSIVCEGSIFLIILICLAQGLCGMTFGLLISATCKTESEAIQCALGSFYPLTMLCGSVWPLEGMPTWLRYIAYTLPPTMAVQGLRSLQTRGWSITAFDVYMGFISSIIWIIIFFVLSILIMKHKSK